MAGSEVVHGSRPSNPKLLGGGMSPTALTWAFASSVAKSSGYMLTSANVIMVSGHGHGFSVQKNHALISVLAGQGGISTQCYSNFGLWMLTSRLSLTASGGWKARSCPLGTYMTCAAEFIGVRQTGGRRQS
jgi:hypothetical protein